MKTETKGCSQGSHEPSDAEREAKGFMVFNATDGIFADPDIMTFAEAMEFVRAFPRRFESQGYYKTASCERIRPENVELIIIPTPDLFASDGRCPACRQSCQEINMDCRLWRYCDTDRIRWSAGPTVVGWDMTPEAWHAVADRVIKYLVVLHPDDLESIL